MTAHNTHKIQISMYLEGFEPATPANEKHQNHVSDRAATGIGFYTFLERKFTSSLDDINITCLHCSI